MIEIKRVSKVYRLKDREVVAVDDVSLLSKMAIFME